MPDTAETTAKSASQSDAARAPASDAHDGRRSAGAPPCSRHVRAIAPAIATAAQGALSYWSQVQESDGSDKDLSSEHVSRDVACAMAAALSEAGIDEVFSIRSAFDEKHVFLVANLGDGVFSIEIPRPISETGSGYNWTRRDGVTVQAHHVFLYRLSDRLSPDAFTAAFNPSLATAATTAACGA